MVFDKLSNISILWITLANKGYIEFTNNFLKSIEIRNIQFNNFVIFCADQDTFNEFKDRCCCIRVDEVLNKHISSDLSQWQDNNYKQIVFTKLDVFLYTLKNTYALGIQHVGYIDMDLVLFSDPTIIMLEHILKYPETSIFCQCDQNPGDIPNRMYTCTNVTQCPQICRGMIVVKNNPDLYLLFYYTDSDVKKLLGDQEFLLAKIYEHNISYRTIDRYVFANGCYPYFPAKYVTPDTCAIHFNYLLNNQKKQFMESVDMWYM